MTVVSTVSAVETATQNVTSVTQKLHEVPDTDFLSAPMCFGSDSRQCPESENDWIALTMNDCKVYVATYKADGSCKPGYICWFKPGEYGIYSNDTIPTANQMRTNVCVTDDSDEELCSVDKFWVYNKYRWEEETYKGWWGLENNAYGANKNQQLIWSLYSDEEID